jgi:hypothetical protein
MLHENGFQTITWNTLLLISNVVSQKSLSFICHSGLDPESSVSELDSRLRGNDDLGTNAKKC